MASELRARVMEAAKAAGYPVDSDRVKWILACGCEPMVYCCEQCDFRREVAWAVDDIDAIARCEARVVELEAKLPERLTRIVPPAPPEQKR